MVLVLVQLRHQQINGGSVDGIMMGAVLASRGGFTSITADSVTLATIDIDGGSVDSAAIGVTSKSTRAFTVLIAGSDTLTSSTSMADL